MAPKPPSTDWKESVAPDEEARFTRHAESLRDIQRARAAGASARRALHAKANCGLEGELTILGDLPRHARAGLFARPATYRAYVRYSNGDGRCQADAIGDVRGLAVKVLGVEGKKVIPGMEQEKTQDLLFIRTPAIPFRNADEFVAVVSAAQQSHLLLLPRVLARLGFGRTFELMPQLSRGLKAPTLSLASAPYYSAVPVRCGDYAVRYALTPHDSPQLAALGSPDALHEELAGRLAKDPVVYDLRLQFFVDETATPIEDASVEWKEADAPYVTVGRLTLPVQDVDGAHGKKVAERVEMLAFDPWHALETHRPLGNVMRARNHAYRLSTDERGAAREPDGSESPGG